MRPGRRRARGGPARRSVWGVDPAPVMLRLARILAARGSPVTWLEGAAEALPLPDAAATVLWSLATVHHWRDLAGGLAEAFRVLAAGGRLLAIERRRRPGTTGLASHGWTDEQARSFAGSCVAAGFVDPHTEMRQIGRKEHLIVTATRSA
jgi:ubiquinone/menaquinone biosynthesis C-methylase UbiE